MIPNTSDTIELGKENNLRNLNMKNITGLYTDSQGFIHTVFYDRSKKLYCMLIHNSKGQYCSSADYNKQDILTQIDGLMRSFRYLGKVFSPIGNTYKDFYEMSKNLGKRLMLTEKGYTHESFYNEARKNHVKIVDVYSCDGMNVIPASDIFEYHA